MVTSKDMSTEYENVNPELEHCPACFSNPCVCEEMEGYVAPPHIPEVEKDSVLKNPTFRDAEVLMKLNPEKYA